MSAVLFVDTRVADYQTLIGSLDVTIQLVLLDANRDGLEQMHEVLKGKTALDAIHIVSHGSDGRLYLGSTLLDSDEVAARSEVLLDIGASLTDAGDILIYGCNVASGELGQGFVEQLSRATGADVAASSDLTGAAGLGGNWILEKSTSTIEAASLNPNGYVGALAIMTGDGGPNSLSGDQNFANEVDSIWGYGGDDFIYGAGGNDSLVAGSGNDFVIGGTGNDTLQGDDGNDDLNGQEGDDRIVGGVGNDFLHGFVGNDMIIGDDDAVSGGGGADSLIGGEGNDTLLGGSGNDRLQGNEGNDSLEGGDGDDLFHFEFFAGTGTNAGNDTADGGAGINTATFSQTDYSDLQISYQQDAVLISAAGFTGIHTLRNIQWVYAKDGMFPLQKLIYNFANGSGTLGLRGSNEALLSVTNASYTVNDDLLSVTGTFSTTVGGTTRTLLTGQIDFSLSSAIGSVTDHTPDLLRLAGLAPTFSSVNLASNDVRLGFEAWALPTEFAAGPASIVANTLVIDSSGPRLGIGGTVEFPDIQVKVLDRLTIQATDWTVSYNALSDKMSVTGSGQFQSGWPSLPSIAVEVTSPGITIASGAIESASLVVKLSEFTVRGWGIKETSLAIDTGANVASGSISLVTPYASGATPISGNASVQLDPFELDSIAITNVSFPNPGIPILTTGWFMKSLGGSLSNLGSTNTTPVLLTGDIGLAGPRNVVKMDLHGEIDVNHVTGHVAGSIYLPQFCSFDGTATINWTSGKASINAEASFAGGLITANMIAQGNKNGDLSSQGVAQVKLTDHLNLSGNYKVQFSNDDNFANDYVAGWAKATASLPLLGSISIVKGVRYGFDGQKTTFGAKEVPLYSSWIVDEGVKDLLVTASWENAATGPVHARVIVYNDLAKTQIREIVDEANFASHGIAVINEWSDSHSRVVFISSPDPGLWDVELVNPTGLGLVSYSATTSYEPSSVSVTNLGLSGSTLTVGFNAVDPNAQANVHFYADNDAYGNDGFLIGTVQENDGAGTWTWDTSPLSAGRYWIYATIEDGISVPVSAYSTTSFKIGGLSGPSDQDDFLEVSGSASRLDGGGGNDTLVGGLGNDTLEGGFGNDNLEGLAGNDLLTGGMGLDTVVYSGARADYSITRSGGKYIVVDNNAANGNDGTDTLAFIERIVFSDAEIGLAAKSAMSIGKVDYPDNWIEYYTVSDFNGDGKTDMWWKTKGGVTGLWTIEGGNSWQPGAMRDTFQDWSAVDSNADGKLDRAIQHMRNGEAIQWNDASQGISLAQVGQDHGWAMF